MEIMDQAQVKEVFVVGRERPALHIIMNNPVTTKDGSYFGEDSPREDLLMAGGSPMVFDEE